MPPPLRSIVFLLIAVTALFSCQEKEAEVSPTPAPPPPPAVSYNFEVRPILARKCFGCHGANDVANESGLRLDSAQFAFAPLGEDPSRDRHAFVPGERAQSEAWKRIHSQTDEDIMPPPDSGATLTEEEKDILGRWIDQGANYEPHWAFQPLPTDIPAPSVTGSGWPAGKIDLFVLATMEQHGLSPAPRADRATLMRRLSLALNGSAPEDDPNKSYEQMVDSLLESDGFAEHFASFWLQTIGYADTQSSDSPQLTSRWVYRDWIIENATLNFDQFLTAQLAGDLLATNALDHTIATAFSRLNFDAPSRAANLSAILGLNLECAQCHDDKSGDISHQDFNSLSAFFSGNGAGGILRHPSIIRAPTKPLPTAEQIQSQLASQADTEAAITNLRHAFADGENAFQDWLAQPQKTPVISDAIGTFTFDNRKSVVSNQSLSGSAPGDASGLKFTNGFSRGAVVIAEKKGVTFPELLPARRWTPWSFTLRLRVPENLNGPVVLLSRGHGPINDLRGLDLVLEDGGLAARLSREWPGKSIAIHTTTPVIAPDHWHLLTWTYDGSSTAEGMVLYLDGRKLATEVLHDNLWKPVFFPEDDSLPLQLGHRDGAAAFAGGAIDDFQVHDRALTALEVATLYNGNSLSNSLARTTENLPALRSYYFSSLHEGARTRRDELAVARKASILPEEDIFEVAIMQGNPASPTVLPSFLAQRNESGNVAASPEVLDRSDLAQAIIDHPLTARVFVNRMWAHFFGRGLLESANDFGIRSPAPSHPELLDWLARDFIDHDWNVKRLCRQIVLSATFQQDSTLRPEVSTIDPQFRLLAQGPSFALPAPQFRDFFLHAAGLLDETGAGEPPQPAGTQPPRRSIYQIQQSAPERPPIESPSDQRCAVDYSVPAPTPPRPELSEQEFQLASRALATMILEDHSEDTDRAKAVYLRLIGRAPTESESTDLLAELDAQRTRLGPNSPNAPTRVQPAGSDIDVNELTAWSGLIQSDLIRQRASRQR